MKSRFFLNLAMLVFIFVAFSTNIFSQLPKYTWRSSDNEPLSIPMCGPMRIQIDGYLDQIFITYIRANGSTYEESQSVYGQSQLSVRPPGWDDLCGVIISASAGSSASLTVEFQFPMMRYNVTGGGYCPEIGLSGSQQDVNYRLYLNGSYAGSSMGTGSAISFGNITQSGTYTVVSLVETYQGRYSSGMEGSAHIKSGSDLQDFEVTGGGTYCSGNPAPEIGLSGSEPCVSYQLYLNYAPEGSPVIGTGSAISFGNRTMAGTYTATGFGGSYSTYMSGFATVKVEPLEVFEVIGGGSYCSDVEAPAVSLSGSQSGVNYQLYLNGSPVGNPIYSYGSGGVGFGTQRAAGTYTVVATNSAGCSVNMAGSANVQVLALNIKIGYLEGLRYSCPGSQLDLAPDMVVSGGTGNYTYSWSPSTRLNATNIANPQCTASVNTLYTLTITDGSSCPKQATVDVTVNPLPMSYYKLTTTCENDMVRIKLSGSQYNTSYILRLNGESTGQTKGGTGSAIRFNAVSKGGKYTVIAQSSWGCSDSIRGNVIVPIEYSPTGGGSYCEGVAGVPIGLSSSQPGINYQLKFNNSTLVGNPLAGTGSAISFGEFLSAGSYVIQATNPISGCSKIFPSGVSISVNALPTIFNVTGGGSYCSGSSVPDVGLSGSQLGVNYQLYLDGSPVGSAIAGNGSVLSFGAQSGIGTYTAVATNSNGCFVNMAGSANVQVVTPPKGNYKLTIICENDYMKIGIDGSEADVKYALKLNGIFAQGIEGTGSSISFNPTDQSGAYTVLAQNELGCKALIKGEVIIPDEYSPTGGGSYCPGGAGLPIGLNGSQPSMNYQLYLDHDTPIGDIVAGTGSAISFGNQTLAGDYLVKAINPLTGCSKRIPSHTTGIVSVIVNPLPTVFNITGGGSYFTGGIGVSIGLSGSQAGAKYQLYLNGSPIGQSIQGTGSLIDFGLQLLSGAYTIVASSLSNCYANMSGTALVSVSVYQQPYNTLSKKLDGICFSVDNGILKFMYDEEYTTIINEKLNFKIYLSGLKVAETGSFSNDNLVYGRNYYSFSLNSILEKGHIYVLEVLNKKSEKWYLKFKYNN